MQECARFKDANEQAQAAYQVASHVDLHLLFLASWYGILASHEQVSAHQLRAIEGSMNALISDGTPPEIRGIVRMVQAHRAGFLGNHRAKFELVEELLSDIPRESPYYRKLGALRAMGHLGHGMGTLVRAELEEIVPNDFDEKGIVVTSLANCVLTGKINSAEQFLNQIASFPTHKYVQLLHRTYEDSCVLLTLMLRLQGAPIPPILDAFQWPATMNWVRSTEALIERKPEEALHWARKFADEEHARIGEPLDFLDQTLVRAELAMGNGRAAKRLLLQLQEKGVESMFDQFYFARAERLLGNEELATKHFVKLREAIDRFDAEGRLDFEMALACEIPVSALVRLYTQSVNITEEAPPIPKKSVVPQGLDAIVGASEEMTALKATISQYASLELPVLISGETGTGKELVARALHEVSTRAGKPFIAVNCGAIPDALIESELFGHASGAFTGAQSAYKGMFREAGEGTVFLDEIADISPRLQTALLRVLETKEVRAVGSSTHFEIRCRVVAATNEELPKLVEEGKFRKDLFYRLQRLEVYVPPLRKRVTDIATLTRHFLNVGRDTGERVSLSGELIEKLEQYKWPGNVRELRNVAERMRVLSSEKLDYTLADLLQCTQLKPNQEGEEGSAPKPLEVTLSTPVKETQAPSMVDVSPSEVRKMLSKGTTTFRRKRRLRELFEEVGELKVSEAAAILGVTPHTASRYMSALCEEGIIEKVKPTASPKSHYYARRVSDSV